MADRLRVTELDFDTIKGCEMIGDYAMVRKGLDWFIEYFPNEYMTLLD